VSLPETWCGSYCHSAIMLLRTGISGKLEGFRRTNTRLETEKIVSSSNTCDLYSGGRRFESRSLAPTLMTGFSWLSSVSPGRCLKSEHGGFLPCSFQFITLCHPIIKELYSSVHHHHHHHHHHQWLYSPLFGPGRFLQFRDRIHS
jgi:hypothetical protein